MKGSKVQDQVCVLQPAQRFTQRNVSRDSTNSKDQFNVQSNIQQSIKKDMSPEHIRTGKCWYHRMFGDRAIKCYSPCNYKSGSGPLMKSRSYSGQSSYRQPYRQQYQQNYRQRTFTPETRSSPSLSGRSSTNSTSQGSSSSTSRTYSAALLSDETSAAN